MKKIAVLLALVLALFGAVAGGSGVEPASAAGSEAAPIEQQYEPGGGYSITPDQYCRLPGTLWTWIHYMSQWDYGMYHVYQCWGYGYAQYMYSYRL